jgi:hypothetical protein
LFTQPASFFLSFSFRALDPTEVHDFSVAMLVLFSFLAIFLWFFSAQAISVNVTIDDTKGDSLTGALVVYAPLNAWNDRANCNDSCPIQPDETMLNDQTWHGSTVSQCSPFSSLIP